MLVVDDSALARRKAAQPLVEAGFDVEEATDGDEALEHLVSLDVDAVLLDYEMPGRDGLEVLATMQEQGLEVPVVVLTGTDDESVARKFLEAGASDFLTKGPLMDARVANAIARVLTLSAPDAPVLDESDPVRVLVVDDSEVSRRVVVETLLSGDAQVDVEEATDGAEGLAAAREGGFDVLLLDHQLPDLSGLELLEALREEGIQTPALALTGDPSPDVARGFMDAGAYDVWSKDAETPLRLQVTVERLARLHRAR